jgi:hypothetical protein
MKAAGIRFRKAGNCFTHLSDFAAAQALVSEFDPHALHTMLDGPARRFVAVHDRFAASLHWSVDQAERATGIVFKDDRLLPELHARIVRTAAVEAGCAVTGTRKYYLTKRAMNLPVVGRQLTGRIILPALAA